MGKNNVFIEPGKNRGENKLFPLRKKSKNKNNPGNLSSWKFMTDKPKKL